MIVTLPLEELVATSDMVALVWVIDKVQVPDTHSTKNLLYVKKILKGSWDNNRILIITTGDQRLEDMPIFPPPCSQALVFLKKDRTGNYTINHMLQGIMKIDDKGHLYGFGYGHTLNEIEQLVKDSASAKKPSIKSAH